MKLLIVDDEVIIRTGLSTVIKWEENGIELLAPAASAEEALMRIPIECPDIILTDIRMTGMTGLELSREVKRNFPYIEIVILSGFDDFAYAQQAMREGISDYLLKNSRPGDIMTAVMRVKQRIVSRREAVLQEAIHQTAFRWKQLDRFLRGDNLLTERESEELLIYYPELRLGSDMEKLELWLVTSASPLTMKEETESEMNEAAAMIRNSLGCVILDWEYGWLLIFRRGQPGAKRLVKASMERAERVYCQPFFAACGVWASNVVELRESLRTAEQTASYRWLAEEARMLAYEDIKDRKGMQTVCTEEVESKLTAVLRSGSREVVKQWIKGELASIRQDAEATPCSVQAYLHSLIVGGYRWLERAAASVGQSMPKLPQLEQLDIKLLTANPEETLQQMLLAIHAQYERLNGSRNEAIDRTVAYIREHLADSLSLAQVAASVHMNPNYFSKLFKQETGKNYIEYVTEARMEWASRLLRETPAKVSEIAKRVGYEDMKHFNQLFKRYSGETPSQYRSK
ncbi:hypothetical protein BSK65_03835 [Paenibacillus odorifer]|uniref:DNA-binding response regulator n=1 Tax=Paenibacillus odorifer TaxID=189426 RepID=A0A1R0ZQ86_9BACL|nr:helix-turn-helix domain-containing protein [Paenibacillus odorifer]OME74806.1 hypothetical protein BSK65_03835 [Paenibacillus odorifer]